MSFTIRLNLKEAARALYILTITWAGNLQLNFLPHKPNLHKIFFDRTCYCQWVLMSFKRVKQATCWFQEKISIRYFPFQSGISHVVSLSFFIFCQVSHTFGGVLNSQPHPSPDTCKRRRCQFGPNLLASISYIVSRIEIRCNSKKLSHCAINHDVWERGKNKV